jgi:hypothetical protein
MPILIKNNERRRELEKMLRMLNNLNQTNEVLKKKRRARELLNMLEPIRNSGSLHPATQKMVNTVVNYSRINAQQTAARALANRYSKMYPLGNNNEKRLIKRFFLNNTSQKRINEAQKNINKIVPSSFMTTRKRRFARFLNLLRGSNM